MTKKSETLEFTRTYLKSKPEASFAEIRDAAAARDLKIYPIVYGRAKALEGLVKVAPYGSKKRAKEAQQAAVAQQAFRPAEMAGPETNRYVPAERAGVAPSGNGSSSGGVDVSRSIEAVIAGMREHHEDRERYRDALVRIGKILDEVL